MKECPYSHSSIAFNNIVGKDSESLEGTHKDLHIISCLHLEPHTEQLNIQILVQTLNSGHVGPWSLPSVSSALRWTNQRTLAAPHIYCSLDPSPSLQPSFGCSLTVLCPVLTFLEMIGNACGNVRILYFVNKPCRSAGNLSVQRLCWEIETELLPRWWAWQLNQENEKWN